MTHRIWPGKPYPLGASWDGCGVNFAIFSEHACRVDLCLFESVDGSSESSRIPLGEQTDGVWHGYIPGLRPGQLYGYRVDGAWIRRPVTASMPIRWCWILTREA